MSTTINYIVLAITGGLTVRNLTKVDWCYTLGAIECVNPLVRVAEALLKRMSIDDTKMMPPSAREVVTIAATI